jgi:hypothetical protein
MNELDEELEQIFREGLLMSDADEDAAWAHFLEQLPERQAWTSFSVAMAQATDCLKQATAWAHWAAPKTI